MLDVGRVQLILVCSSGIIMTINWLLGCTDSICLLKNYLNLFGNHGQSAEKTTNTHSYGDILVGEETACPDIFRTENPVGCPLQRFKRKALGSGGEVDP